MPGFIIMGKYPSSVHPGRALRCANCFWSLLLLICNSGFPAALGRAELGVCWCWVEGVQPHAGSVGATHTEDGVLGTGQHSSSREPGDVSHDSLEHLLGCQPYDVSALGEGVKGGSRLQPAMSWRCEFSK